MERVQLGLIGLGLIGTAHARTLAKIEECDLVAFSDVDERHAETAARLGINFYRDYQGDPTIRRNRATGPAPEREDRGAKCVRAIVEGRRRSNCGNRAT